MNVGNSRVSALSYYRHASLKRNLFTYLHLLNENADLLLSRLHKHLTIISYKVCCAAVFKLDHCRILHVAVPDLVSELEFKT